MLRDLYLLVCRRTGHSGIGVTVFFLPAVSNELNLVFLLEVLKLVLVVLLPEVVAVENHCCYLLVFVIRCSTRILRVMTSSRLDRTIKNREQGTIPGVVNHWC